MKYSGIFIILFFSLFSANSQAQNIYSWTDSKGKVHFSTSSKNKNQKPKKLPKIKKENLDQKIKNIRLSTPANCDAHGGIDCSLGADSDGSILCVDGFKDVNLSFASSCAEAKIQTSYFLIIDSDKEEFIKIDKKIKEKLQNKIVKSLQVSIRNLSGVKVNKIEIEFVLDRKYPVFATGPKTIEPYGAADYLYNLTDFEKPLNNEQIEHSKFKVYCSNCGIILSTDRNE